MVEEGHDVTCVAPDSFASCKILDMGARFCCISLVRSGLNPLQDIKYMFGMVKIMWQIKPDFVLAYTIKPVIFGALAAKLTGVRNTYSIITGLGYAFMNNDIKQRFSGLIAKSLYRVALKNNKKVFFQNPDDMKEFLNYKIVKKDQCVLVNGSGVDLEKFTFCPVRQNSPIRFLLVARLLKEKGIIEYLEAAKLVKQNNSDVQFDLVGPEDPSPSGLKINDIKAYIDQGVVTYHGRTENVIPYMTKTSVYVLPSYREGTPRTVLEAMAIGRPVITTDAPGCRETVIDGSNGFLVPVKNSKAIFGAMLKFIENPVLISQMGLASRKLVEKKYNVHQVNKVLLRHMGLA
jgi:glycosyltransferase involved in cell wall biosynthesis